MAVRGRKPQFKPYARTAGGVFSVYVPGRGAVSLDTTDAPEAQRKADAFAAEYSAKRAPAAQAPKPAFSPPPSPTPAPVPLTTSQDMLQSWAQSPLSSTVSPQQSQDTRSQSQSPLAAPSLGASDGALKNTSDSSTAAKVDKVLPQDKRERMAKAISGVAASINLLLAGAACHIFGRIPDADVDDLVKELLATGWELQLAEVFVEHPPEPWMLIAGCTVAAGFSMYMGGTPKAKKPLVAPPPDAADANG